MLYILNIINEFWTSDCFRAKLGDGFLERLGAVAPSGCV